jgi:hypothetical protein
MSDVRESGIIINIVEPDERFIQESFCMDIEPDEVVSVMNTRNMIIYYVGKNTGRTYVFNGAGSVVEDVDKIDADEMVNLPVTPSCCGSFPTPYFQIVGR